MTIFSDAPPTPEHNGCSVTIENLGLIVDEADYKSEASSGEETDSDTTVQPNLGRPYRKVLRLAKGGRQRLKRGGHDERITGSIRLSEYLSYKASTVDTPSYSLLISSKTPTPNTSKKVTPTTVLLDTRASISLLPLWKAQELGVEVKKKEDVRVRGADGKLLAVTRVSHIFARDKDATF